MNVFIIIGSIVTFLVVFIVVKRNKKPSKRKPSSILLSTENDKPIDFGYKMVWIAVKTKDYNRIAEILELGTLEAANWESGIELAYKNGIFITPSIGLWTLVVGMPLLGDGTLKDVECLEVKLNRLSEEFGEAQSFGSHRVVEYHHWMKSVHGKTKRVYAYIGEKGENIKVCGALTELEMSLNLFNSFSKEAKDDDYLERDNLDYADEDLVMQIAGNWSINPIKLSERTDIEDNLGFVAYY